MNLNDYQEAAGKYQLASPNTERIYGLFEESGEVAGVFKRKDRGDYETQGEFLNALIKELGDVLWYLSRVAADNSITMEEVAYINLSKLDDRKMRNKLQGSGDNR